MKLYASVTSERATKGQGGKYLDILIQDENKNPLATIQVKCLENNYQLHLEMLAKGHERTGKGYFHSLIGATKGEKQKGECVSMAHLDDIQKYGHCLECQRTI